MKKGGRMNGYLIAATVIVGLVAAGCTGGAAVLWRGTPESWPDVVGSDAAMRGTAIGLAFAALVLWAAVGALIGGTPYRIPLAAGALALFVIGGFAGNYAVFHSLRPEHTGTNVVIAAIAGGLLWLGRAG